MIERSRLKLECAADEGYTLVVDTSTTPQAVWLELRKKRSVCSLKLTKDSIRELMGFLLEVLANV